jgi:hypothetical protein
MQWCLTPRSERPASQAAIAIEVRRLSLTARLDANKRLGRHDAAAAKAAEQELTELRQGLERLDAATKGTDPNAAVASQAALIERYHTALLRAESINTEQLSLVNGVMRQAGEAMAANAVKAKDRNFADQATALTMEPAQV